jgi:hypothetical protein
MIITNKDKKLSIKVVGYEFPDAKPEDAGYDYDANWLNCEVCYTEGEKEGKYIAPCILTDELASLISALEELSTGKRDSYMSNFVESYLIIAIDRAGDNFLFTIKFIDDNSEMYSVTSVVGEKRIKEIIKDLNEDKKTFPQK